MKIWDNLQPNYLENLKKETLRKSLVKEIIFNSERVIGDIRCWVNEVKISWKNTLTLCMKLLRLFDTFGRSSKLFQMAHVK